MTIRELERILSRFPDKEKHIGLVVDNRVVENLIHVGDRSNPMKYNEKKGMWEENPDGEELLLLG